jgi:hypothetical protein
MVWEFDCKMSLIKNKQPREQQFFGGEFSPRGNKKINPVQLIKTIFSKKMHQSHNF